MMPCFRIGKRYIGEGYSPLVIAEVGINHEGSLDKAFQMVDDAALVGCECIKFQSHIIEDEMVPSAQNIIPSNAEESIWNIMKRCSLSEGEERELKKYVESKGLIFLSTPFSRAAALRLERLGVEAYKIGSGECNNYPLVELIASFKKPVILSTGMNDIASIMVSVNILRKYQVPFALLHCTSMYPTPYDKVRLGALHQLKAAFPDAVLGLSDHCKTIYPCLGAVALGASIIERHFTSDKAWPGPDIPISMDPKELGELIYGSKAIYKALGGTKDILPEEKPTIDFAYACVVAETDIKQGDILTETNIWVKRPGTGEIPASEYRSILGRKAKSNIFAGNQIRWEDLL